MAGAAPAQKSIANPLSPYRVSQAKGAVRSSLKIGAQTPHHTRRNHAGRTRILEAYRLQRALGLLQGPSTYPDANPRLRDRRPQRA
jgi:hypothetical protein